MLELNKESFNEYLNRTFHITETVNQEGTTNTSSKITFAYMLLLCIEIKFWKATKMYQKSLSNVRIFVVHWLRVLTNPDVTWEAEQSLKIIKR